MVQVMNNEKLDHTPLLPEDSGSDSELTERTEARANLPWLRRRYRCDIVHTNPLLSHILVFLVTCALWGGIFIATSNLNQKPQLPNTGFDLGLGHTIFAKRKYTGCGFSVEDAKERGCKFDILANHFVPSPCYDQYSNDQYQAEGDTWIGYVDRNWSEAYTSIQAMGESDVYWTNQRDHIVHCAMLWKRQWRAFTENWRYFDAIISDEEHTMHCAQYLMDMTDMEGSPDCKFLILYALP